MTDYDKLDWSLLKQNGCPKCGAELTKSDSQKTRYCLEGSGHFVIQESRFQEIVNDRGGEHG